MPARLFRAFFLLIAISLLTPLAVAIDQAMPADHPPISQSAPAATAAAEPVSLVPHDAHFRETIQLDDLRLLALGDSSGQVKILDSWARQSLKKIYNRESYNGEDPLYTALDMMIRPEAWNDENIIFVQAVPIREQLTRFAEGATPIAKETEAHRILQTGLISPAFLERTEVLQVLQQIQLDVRKAESVGKISIALDTLNKLGDRFTIAPPGVAARGTPWHQPIELMVNNLSPKEQAENKVSPVPGYSAEQALRVSLAIQQFGVGWRQNDAALANKGISTLVALLPTIDPNGYPSHAKRITELWYNRTFYGTVANVFLYFVAMTLFLLVAVGVNAKLRRPAYVIFTIAVILHIASMGIRMWLAGRWPTQNEFESVLGAALLGCVVGWLLETWKKNGLFGMAFSFVGFLAMTACMAAPYMFGTDLGGAIAKTAGILQTYWLYIHVNIVISSYALISASFIMGVVYLLIRQWHWINPLEAGSESRARSVSEGREDPPSVSAPLATQLATAPAALSTISLREIQSARSSTLATLDQANMVILQMAFWFLGIGIICGAVWADHSWGRPWGWDPKETFALITWIVYLIIVHVRIVAPKAKADTTAWLSVIGFGVMMFNWIGVNFFLAGLHSYA